MLCVATSVGRGAVPVGARAGRHRDPEIECEIRKRGIFALRPHGGPGDTLRSVLITRSRLIELVEKGARSAQERVEVAPVVA